MRALILDFDGLILDTEWPSYLAWQEEYQARGVSLALSDWVARVGSDGGFDPVAHLERLTGQAVRDRAALLAHRLARKVALIGARGPLPGVMARLDEAAALGWPVAVASSSGAAWVHGYLGRLGLHHRLAAVRTREDVSAVKPDPELYRVTAAALSVPPAACVVCEDSRSGVQAAKAAGMFVIAVPNRVTAVLDLSEADRVVGSLDEVSLAEL